MMIRPLIVILCLSWCWGAQAKGEYLSVEAFLGLAFTQQPPQPQTLWLDEVLAAQAETILTHPYRGLRIRYWGADQRTAWVFNEIGKEQPITIGVVVQAGQIEQVQILAFRESRGGEVRYPFFTDQFVGAGLTEEQQLDRTIDGISGATLSVWAVRRVAQLALLLHQHSPFGASP